MTEMELIPMIMQKIDSLSFFVRPGSDWLCLCPHYGDVIMTTIASQITSLTGVYSIVYSDADQGKHQSSASLAFVWGIHRDRWIPRTKGQLRGKCFHLMTSSCFGITSPIMKRPGRIRASRSQLLFRTDDMIVAKHFMWYAVISAYQNNSFAGTNKLNIIQAHIRSCVGIIIPPLNEVEEVYTGFNLSVRPSVRGQNRVRSVPSTILAGSISYLHILSSNFRRCVAC